jgi:DNA-binding GntR family transcriptional regulator
MNLTDRPQTGIRRRQQPSLVDLAYEAVLEAIVDCQLKPGERVNLDGLAADLEMSNTPIREALARLTSTGLVQQISNRGYVVTPILSTEEYHHLFDARCLIEIDALCQAELTSELLTDLLNLARQLEGVGYGTTFRTFNDPLNVDESFHLQLLRASGNRFLEAAWKSLNFYPHVSRLHTTAEAFENENVYRASLHQHVQIIERLQNDQRDQAVELLGQHIRSVEDRLLKSRGRLADDVENTG